MELQIKDLETVETRLAKTIKAAQTERTNRPRCRPECLQKSRKHSKRGKPARAVEFDSEEEERFARELFPAYI